MKWRVVLLAAVAIALIWFLTLIPKTVEVFIIATLIAYGVNPVVRRLMRRMPRAVAVGLVYAVLVVVTVIASVIIVPDTLNQLQAVFGRSGTYLAWVQQAIASAQQWAVTRFGSHALPPQFSDLEGRVAGQISTLLNVAFTSAGGFLVGIANGLLIGITAVVLSYYLLAHSDEIRDSFFSLFPNAAQEKAQIFSREVARAVGGFIYGQIVLSLSCGVAVFVVLLIARSDYALLLGVLTGLLYAVPYLGILVALIVGGLLGGLQSWSTAIIDIVTIFVVTRFADLVLVPKVMAQSVGISPMAIIFSVFAGGELFGLWGLVLAIPAAAVFKVAWRIWLHPWLTGRKAVLD